MEKTLGIVGSGVSGLCAGKYGQAAGFKISIFEKNEDVGGLWENKSGYTWDSLRTNNSKYTFQFSDFPANYFEKSEDFLTNKQVQRYLKDYAVHNKIYDKINFNSLVINLEKVENKFRITYQNTISKETKVEIFDYIIISTGFYNLPKLDDYSDFIKDPSNNKLKFVHSNEYRNPKQFENKNVCIVGASFSGTQIAVEIAKSAKSVVNVFRRRYWFLKKTMPHKTFQKELPNDFLVFSRGMYNESVTPKMRNIYYSQITSQNKTEELYVDANSELPIKIVLADDYLESIERGSIKIINGKITEIKNNIVRINNVSYDDFDYVLFCTGYKVELNFLGDNISKYLDYNPNLNDFPLNLYNCTFNPKLPNFACVGVFLGSFTGSAEIQAKYAIRYISEKLDLDYREIQNHLDGEEKKRKEKDYKIPSYAVSNYVSFCDRLAKEMKILPDLQQIKKEDEQLYNLLFNGPIVQSEYVDDLNASKKSALKQMLLEYIKPKF